MALKMRSPRPSARNGIRARTIVQIFKDARDISLWRRFRGARAAVAQFPGLSAATPMAIAPGAVQDGMDIKRVANDREKYLKRKTLGQYATYAITSPDD